MNLAYEKGVDAFRRGQPNSENPFPCGGTIGGGMNEDRVQFFDGWYDAMFADKYPQWPGVE